MRFQYGCHDGARRSHPERCRRESVESPASEVPPSDCESLVIILHSLPETSVAELVDPLSSVISTIAKSAPDSLREQTIAFWDRVLPPAAAVPRHTGPQDCLNEAINHPLGKLTEALLRILHSRTLKRNEGIATDVRQRLDTLMAMDTDQAQLARVIICSRVALLHDLDSTWAAQNVIRLFDWSNPSEASRAWRGYLWAPWVSPGLWGDLKPHFLNTFDHLAELGEDSAVGILGAYVPAVAVQGWGELSTREAGSCLRRMGEQGREAAARWLAHKMKEADAHAAPLWGERIGPWLREAWPKEPALRSRLTSLALAQVAVASGDAFLEAVDVIKDLVGPVEMADSILEELVEKKLATLRPEAALDLAANLAGENPELWFGKIAPLLEAVAASAPALRSDPRFVRLREIAVRLG